MEDTTTTSQMLRKATAAAERLIETHPTLTADDAHALRLAWLEGYSTGHGDATAAAVYTLLNQFQTDPLDAA